MTEEEAKTKWCPLNASWLSGPESTLRKKDEANIYNCIASDCMMWRYFDTSINGKKRGDGYCGLAGK